MTYGFTPADLVRPVLLKAPSGLAGMETVATRRQVAQQQIDALLGINQLRPRPRLGHDALAQLAARARLAGWDRA